VWAGIDAELEYAAARTGLAELALSGCTTVFDHHYVFPRGRAGILDAELRAARELGLRIVASRGSMDLGASQGGLPPDELVEDLDEILADTERVAAWHEPGPGARVQIAVAPCSPFSVTTRLMEESAALARRLGLLLHTHLAETVEEDAYCLELYGCRPVEYLGRVGWLEPDVWCAHCVHLSAEDVAAFGERGVGVAHCPSSNMMIGGGGLAPVHEFRAAGVPVGIGCDGSASTDSASLWMEARNALLLGRMRKGPQSMGARDALEIATRGSAACLGREGELGVLAPGAVGDLVCWPLEGIAFAGAISDPVEAWLRCGPVSARHTVVQGRALVEDGALTVDGVDEMLARHRSISARIQGA
jgi:cytosine/adenosine deaminase-related metal-dependent hydrolase